MTGPISSKPVKLIGASWCPHCDEAQKVLKEQINSGKIQVILEKDPNWKGLVDKHEIEGLPTFVLSDDKTKCDLTGKDEFSCTDGTTKKISELF